MPFRAAFVTPSSKLPLSLTRLAETRTPNQISWKTERRAATLSVELMESRRRAAWISVTRSRARAHAARQ